ncbi:MAG: hypothetical protein JSV02_02590 [Dehalococcoidia bacterium]|nr:MAG: hypothetical protein JSV02_02590 [Dehalococcoidia bacterium]
MLNNELRSFNEALVDKTNQNTLGEPSTFKEIAEMLTLSEDVARNLPVETVHKLWDCYIDMIVEVKERLNNLYESLLIEFNDLCHSSHEKSDYPDLASSLLSDGNMLKYRVPINDWNKYFAVN